MIRNLRRYAAPREKVMIAGASPLLYYLTDTVPFTGSPWAELYTPEAFRLSFETALAENGMPILIFPNTNTNDDGWPVSGGGPVNEFNQWMYDYLYAFASVNLYATIEIGPYIEIRVPPDKPCSNLRYSHIKNAVLY
jgi:hypothetical protein